jgi:hypothetical protein
LNGDRGNSVRPDRFPYPKLQSDNVGYGAPKWAGYNRELVEGLTTQNILWFANALWERLWARYGNERLKQARGY